MAPMTRIAPPPVSGEAIRKSRASGSTSTVSRATDASDGVAVNSALPPSATLTPPTQTSSARKSARSEKTTRSARRPGTSAPRSESR